VQEWREHRHEWASHAFSDSLHVQAAQAADAWAEIAKDLRAMQATQRSAQKDSGTEPADDPAASAEARKAHYAETEDRWIEGDAGA
jgi:hypothetical protein